MDPEHHEEGVLPPPNSPNDPGEMGKPVKIDNPAPNVKSQIDEGWKKNAFNQVQSMNSQMWNLNPHANFDLWCDSKKTKGESISYELFWPGS